VGVLEMELHSEWECGKRMPHPEWECRSGNSTLSGSAAGWWKFEKMEVIYIKSTIL